MSIKDVDTHKLMYHPERVSEWLRLGTCIPLHAEIGITNRCNHRCSFCTLDWITHGKDDIHRDIMYKALGDMVKAGVKSVYFAGEGEPTLHKDFPDFVLKAHSLGLKVAVSTNGSLFDKEMARKVLPFLSWIRFSVDTAVPELYSKIHGVSEKEIKKVLKNIESSVELKRANELSVQIGVQAIALPETIPHLEGLSSLLYHYIFVDNLQIKPAHNHPNSSFSPELYEYSYNELYDRLMKYNHGMFSIVVRKKSMERLDQPRTYKECHGFHFYTLIAANGDVVPCNIFYNQPRYSFGNLYVDDFETIWYSDRRLEVINKITDLGCSQCGNYRCRFDVMNRYLERVKNPEVNDEFI